MNVLMICDGDWGGSAYAIAQAVNETTEHEARLISMHKGYTAYQTDIFRPSPKDIAKWIEWADVVNVHDAADMLIPIDALWRPVLQTFRGSWYRQRPDSINERAKRRHYVTSCISPDLVQYGPAWLPRAMPDLASMWEPADEFTVIHAPTKRTAKGTESLIEACEGLGVALDLIEGVSNKECLARKAKGRLLVDQTASGVGTGFCGNALEAWSMGMPVISHANDRVKAALEAEIGELPFCRARKELGEQILKFKNDKAYWEKWAQKGRAYWKKFHSPEASAERFMSLCESALHESTPPDPVRISVCMIARNEEAILGKAIASTKGLADEVVVLDTGSEDRTVAVASESGAKVIEGGDRWHKGEARNRAIRESTGDWVVILDADETLVEPAKLRAHINLTYADGLMIRMTRVKGGQETLAFHQQRVWRKGAFWYKYRAHELPLPAEKGMWIEKTPYVWAHEQPSGRKEWKADYTLKRLELDVKENPEDARPVYYLARQLGYMKDEDPAYEPRSFDLLQKYIAMTERTNAWDRPNACHDLSTLCEKRGDQKGRIRALLLACEAQPTNRRWWAELARCYFENGQQELGIGLMKSVLELSQEREDGYSLPLLHGPYPHDMLSQWCFAARRYEEGYEHCKEALAWLPDNARLRSNLSEFRKRLG